MHCTNYGSTLKEKYPRLAKKLKISSKAAKTKKAKCFSRAEVERFVGLSTPGAKNKQQRALASLAFLGGLRCAELRSVQIEGIKAVGGGLQVDFEGVKRTAEQADRSFGIPEGVFCTVVKEHIAMLEALGITSGPVARRPSKDNCKFDLPPIGKNTLYLLPKAIAVALQLDPQGYSGHSLRRSSAKAAADGGATTFDLRRHYGWASEAVPQRYVDGSTAAQARMASFILSQTQPLSQPVSHDVNIRLTIDVKHT